MICYDGNISGRYLKEVLGKMDLVLRCSIASNQMQSIDTYMCAYSPCEGTCEGVPIWNRNESLSQTISAKASMVINESLVLKSTPNYIACYLSIGESRWMLSKGVLPETAEDINLAMMSKRQLGDSDLCLSLEPQREADYFDSHDPLSMVLTKSSFSPWLLRADRFDEEAIVSVAVTPAMFITRMLDIIENVPEKLCPRQQRRDLLTP